MTQRDELSTRAAEGENQNETGGAMKGGATGAGAGALAAGLVGTVILGPIGTLLGAVGGALGGWWVGMAAGEEAKRISAEDDEHYRSHFQTSSDPAKGYEEMRPVYQFGFLAGTNPDYAGREFTDLEPELRDAWRRASSSHGDWESVRDYARFGFEHRRRAAGQRADREVPLPVTGGGGAMAADLDAGTAGTLDPNVGDVVTGSDSRPRASYSDPLPTASDAHEVAPSTLPDRKSID